jgi:uncharacterized repeat protein (TIGR01451 family)
MRFRLAGLLAGAAVLALSAGGALASVDQLDQHQDGASATEWDAGDWRTAQTFTAAVSGQLDRVSVWSMTTGWSITVDLREGGPTGTVLGTSSSSTSVTAGGWLDAGFSPTVQVTAGSVYAIVIPSGGSTRIGGTCDAGAYTRGEALASNGGAWQLIPDITGSCITDLAFRTYVVPDAVVQPPSISAAFSAPSMIVGQAVSINFTITNAAGNGPVTGVAFSDTLPTGLSVSNGSTSTCNGGTLTRTSPSSIALSGGSLADGASCTVSAMVTGNAAGSYTITSGNVSSTEGGQGNTATASINVDAYPSIAAAFNPSSVAVGATTQLTITITNPAGNPDTLRFIDLADTPRPRSRSARHACSRCRSRGLSPAAIRTPSPRDWAASPTRATPRAQPSA